MGMFGFLKKKKDDIPQFPALPSDNLGLDKDFTMNSNFDPVQQQNFQFPPTLERMQGNDSQFPTNTFHPNRQFNRVSEQSPDIISKNLELISAKIDTLKASIDGLSQRLANLEAMARNEQDKSRYKW